MSKIVKKKDLDVLIESTLEKAGIKSPKKKVVVKESYFRFDPKGSWFDVDDYSYDELPENDYEDMEYNEYSEFVKDYPNHKHFQGSRNPEASTRMFDNYKQKYGPLKGKRLKNMNMEESKSSNKSLINEELTRFNKLSNYTYKK
jgi:hypothetical protein